MDIMEEINKKRRGEEITKESVSEIMKEMAPDMTEALKDYAPVIDQVIQDFGVSSEYGIYEEDGHMFMCIPTSAVDLKSVDGYTYTTEGKFTIVQLDAVNKECGSMGAGTSGASNARYSDKPKKSKVRKGEKYFVMVKFKNGKVSLTQAFDTFEEADSEKSKIDWHEDDVIYSEVISLSRLIDEFGMDENELLSLGKSKTEKSIGSYELEQLKNEIKSIVTSAPDMRINENELIMKLSQRFGDYTESEFQYAIDSLVSTPWRADSWNIYCDGNYLFASTEFIKSKAKKALVEGETIGGLPYDLSIDGHLLSTNSISSDNMYDCHYGRYAIDHSDDLWLDIESWHHGRKYRINNTPGINYPTPKAEFNSWEGVEDYVRTHFLNKSKTKKSYDLESIREMLQNEGFGIERSYERDGYMSFILDEEYTSNLDSRLTGLLPLEFTSDGSKYHIGNYNGGYTWVKLYK